MESSPPAPEFPFEREDRWNSWRGSPHLLAHIARVALRYAAEDGRSAHCTIDFEVDEDHEIFSSPEEFVATVTREALRRFTEVHISVVGKALTINVTLRRSALWYERGVGSPAERILVVRGEEEPSVEDALAAMRVAMRRAGPPGKWGPREKGDALASVAGLAVSAGILSALFLLDVPDHVPVLVFYVICVPLGLLTFGGTFLGQSWIYPSIEVAASGQTNLSRVVKSVGPLIATLVVGAIAKWLYGGG
jgi:hypothetical protein